MLTFFILVYESCVWNDRRFRSFDTPLYCCDIYIYIPRMYASIYRSILTQRLSCTNVCRVRHSKSSVRETTLESGFSHAWYGPRESCRFTDSLSLVRFLISKTIPCPARGEINITGEAFRLSCSNHFSTSQRYEILQSVDIRCHRSVSFSLDLEYLGARCICGSLIR